MPPRINIAQLARSNESALKAQFEALMNNHPKPELVRELYDYCEPRWSVSVNCWAFQLLFLLEQGIPYNKYRYVNHTGGTVYLETSKQQVGETIIDWDEFLKVLQIDPKDAEYALRRMAFNSWAAEEENFSYGAYFVEGEGASDFGEFSLIMKSEMVRSMKGMSFLIKDSLKDYLNEAPVGSGIWSVDAARIEREAASAVTVTYLMCIKLYKWLELEDVISCRERICTMDDYLEGQMLDSYSSSAIEIARVKKPDSIKVQRLTDLITRDRLNLPNDQLTLEERRTRDFHKSIATMTKQNVKIAYI